jgi:SSS family transporter
MSPLIIIISILSYFSFLMIIAWYTSQKANNASYFLGNKQSPWYAVAFGMIGDSLSGVTFISLPGTVVNGQFSYMQLVLGYLLGYLVIAQVLLPLYYKLNVTSIYSYLNNRFGSYSQKTGSLYFLLSRTIGAALRLYLAAGVIQLFVFDSYGVPFAVTVAIIIALMLLYTYKGGIKTLVWTDTFQSALLLLGVILSITAIMNRLDFSLTDAVREISNSQYSKVFFGDWQKSNYFPKMFLSGAFIAIVMTGLDQNMMQKNLSCPNLKDAQKNIYWFSIVLVFVNLFFVALGAMLYIFAEQQGITLPMNAETGKIITDKVFPFLALGHLGTFAAIVFILGLTAATFSSADSVLTTLTTSFCIDFLNIEEKHHYSEKKKTNARHIVHIAFAIILFITILLCNLINSTSVLDAIFIVAAYTYGPLLGLFTFGLFTKKQIHDGWAVPLISVISIGISYLLKENSEQWFNGYKFGYELLLINGTVMFLGLLTISKSKDAIANLNP